MVTKAQISKLKPPAIKLVDLVCQELMSISREITTKVEKWEQNKLGCSIMMNHTMGVLRIRIVIDRFSFYRWTEEGFAYNLPIVS